MLSLIIFLNVMHWWDLLDSIQPVLGWYKVLEGSFSPFLHGSLIICIWELVMYNVYAFVIVTGDYRYPSLFGMVVGLCSHLWKFFRGCFWGFFSLLTGLIFYLCHQLKHWLQIILFFSLRHTYSVPTYTGYFYYSMPKLYAWLSRMSYKRYFSKKYRAFKSRQSYLIFVWFYFSYFFRALFLLPMVFYLACYRSLISVANGAFGIPLGSLYFLFYRIFYHTFVVLLLRYNAQLALRCYEYYLVIRRYLYYMNANEYTSYGTSIFVEKAKRQKEKLAFYDPHAGDWNLASAAPKEMPPMRPSFFYLISKFVSPLSAKGLVTPASFWGYRLASFLILVSKAILFSLWWPFLLVIENVLLALEDSPTTFAFRTAFLTNLAHLSKIVAGRSSAIATFVLLPFFMVGNLVFLAWPSLSLRLISTLTYIFYVFYVILWNFLWLLASAPMLLLFMFTRPLVFFFRRFNYFLWAFILLAFGGYFLIYLGYFLGEFLPVASGLFGLPPQGLYPEQRFRSFWLLLSEYHLRDKWVGHMHTSFRHWWRKWYQYHSTINYDPFIFLGSVQYYWTATERRGTHLITQFQREMLSFYTNLEFASSGKCIKRTYLLLDKIVQPGFPDHRAPLTWEYRVAYFWINRSFHLLVSPILLLGFQLLQLEHSLGQLLATARSYYILGSIVNIYVAHYQFLGKCALALISFCIQASSNGLLFLKSWGSLLYYDWFPIILQGVIIIALELQSQWRELLALVHGYLKQQLSQGSLWAWYSELLLSCWEHQLSLYISLVAPETKSPVPSKSWFYTPSALLASFISTLLRFCYSVIPLMEPGSLNLSSADVFRFYLYCVVFLIKLWDTIGIYWQLAKLPWESFADWEHYRHIRKHKKSTFLRHKHISRKSWFSPMFVQDIWQTFIQSCCDRPYVSPRGSELRPHYSKWTLLSEILSEDHYIFLVLTLLAKEDFHHPLYSPVHAGYIPRPLTGKYSENYYYPSVPGSPLTTYLSKLRLWSSPLESPFFYYGGLFFLVLFSSSFRGLFFPKLFEGGSVSHWNRFLANRDPQVALSLVLPPVPTYEFEWYDDFTDYEQEILEPASRYLRKVQEDAGYSGTSAIHSFEDYRNLLESLRNQIPNIVEYRQDSLRSSRNSFWNRSLLTGRSKLSHSGRELQTRWDSKLWPHVFDFRNSAYFRDLSYSYFFYDFKIQTASRNLQKLFFALPQKTVDFFISFVGQNNYDLEAAYACANFDEHEEVRAEYLYRSDKLHRRLLATFKQKVLLEMLDKKYFDHTLGHLFTHKDGSTTTWISEEMSVLMASRELKMKFTPLIFSKYIRAQRYVLTYHEDVSSYPFFCFWFFVFPLIIIAEAFLRHYEYETGWSPRKGRYNHSEAWALWVNIFLHFDILVDNLYYLWAWGSTTLHMVRAGARGAMDEPGKWWRKSGVTGNYYFWDWLTHWRYATLDFRSYHTPWLFRTNNLTELRFFNKGIFFLHILLGVIFLYKQDISRRKPRFFLISYRGKIPSLSVMFAQQNFYGRVKENLRRGLLYIWLQRKR